VAPSPDVVPINRPRDRSPVEELAAQVARSSRDEPIPGMTPHANTRELGGRGQLTAIDGGLIKDPIVPSDASRNPVTFKAILDKGAQRAASLSGVGLVLCMAPLLSLLGMIWGITSLRRIKRSNGNLTGEKTARFAIYVGLVGFLIGATIDMVLIIRG
jgi:hypothetical protein